jgi:hypothetical protein
MDSKSLAVYGGMLLHPAAGLSIDGWLCMAGLTTPRPLIACRRFSCAKEQQAVLYVLTLLDTGTGKFIR